MLAQQTTGIQLLPLLYLFISSNRITYHFRFYSLSLEKLYNYLTFRDAC
jgi:hypothetical protein